MSFTVTLDPPAVAYQREELDLNDGAIMVDQKGIDWGDGAIQAYMANEQRWGSTAVSYRVPNRNVSIPLFVSDDGPGFDANAMALRQKVATIQREGGWLKRETSRGGIVYADIQSATLRFPDVWGDTGALEPNVDLTLECLPDFYGDIIALDTLTGQGEISTVLQKDGAPAVIEGDHPARTQVIVTDTSGQDQYGVLWGFRCRHYGSDPGNALVWSGGQLTNAAGAIDVVEGTARSGTVKSQGCGSSWTDIASLVGSHVGSYQIWARINAQSGGSTVRARWSIGDTSSPIANRTIYVPTVGAYVMVNLGQVRLDSYPVGGQQWHLTVQGEGGTIKLDTVFLQPVDEAAGHFTGDWATNPAILGGQRALLRSENPALRATAGGVYFTPVETFGDLPRLPPSAMEGRPVEGLFKMSRGDLGANPDSARDNFSVTVTYRPTYLFRP